MLILKSKLTFQLSGLFLFFVKILIWNIKRFLILSKRLLFKYNFLWGLNKNKKKVSHIASK